MLVEIAIVQPATFPLVLRNRFLGSLNSRWVCSVHDGSCARQ